MGILCAHGLRIPLAFSIGASIGLSVLAILPLVTNYHRIAATLVAFGFLCAGCAATSVEENSAPPNGLKKLIERKILPLGAPVEVTGVLPRDPEISYDRTYFDLNIESIRSNSTELETSGTVTLLMNRTPESLNAVADLDLRYGARVRIMTSLERADDFRNPGVSPFTEFLDRRGYDASAFVKSPVLIERLANTRVFLPLAWLYTWRQTLQKQIDTTFSRETAGVLDASLLGNRHTLSKSSAARFREGGTFHVLVISGLHITFLGGLIFFIAGHLTRNKVIRFAASVVVLWGYAVAVGAEASVVRAALMFSVVLLAPLLARNASSLNLLGGVAIALLVSRPSDLFDPSFQLTFLSVLAIVAIAWPLLERMSAIGRWRPTRESPYPPASPQWLRTFCEVLFWSERAGQRELAHANYSYRLLKSRAAAVLERFYVQSVVRYAFAAIVVSVCVQAVLAPFLIVYFHRISFASIALNIGVSILMAVVIACATLGLALAQISSSFAQPFITLTEGLNWAMVHSVDPFASLGVASIRLPEYSGSFALVYVAFYVPLVVLINMLWRWKPLELQTRPRQSARLIIVLFAQILLSVAIVAHPFSSRGHDGKLRVDFLDVGQGDCALITTPDGTTLLIDGGGRPGPFNKASPGELEQQFEPDSRGIGEAVVSEYLWWRGLKQIDYVIATHADADHIDGLNDVARNFSVRAALAARTPPSDREYLEFTDTLASQRVPIRLIGGGDVLRVGGVELDVLWPWRGYVGAPSANNASLVMRLRYGERTLLFTGDIEAAAESGLLRIGDQLKADVVKVPHHGSKTSSTQSFVTATSPRLAVISVGQTSIFGHPHRKVVERWKAAGAEVLTTGNSGMITIVTDGRALKVETFARE